MADTLKRLQEAYEYDVNAWTTIRAEAKTDMQYVAGDPWTREDKALRKGRPTVAPEEMSQYRNQVINALMAHPRGGKFAPIGNGATDKAAQFYQDKWREIEYRSHASLAYIQAADNALQRSYGFVRVGYDYQSPRAANMELYIEGFPNPDMVLPDSDALRYDSADMQHCFVHRWVDQKAFTRKYPKAKIKAFGDIQAQYPKFIQGNKVLESEFWYIQTRPRKLLLIQPTPPTQPQRQYVPTPQRAVPPVQMFEDELLDHFEPGSFTVVRPLRDVDYPEVKMCLTNGIEILSEHDWLGKYIPIVSCYGKVLYVEGDTGMERQILSMTRFGRDPWKSYCYASSQQLEIVSQVPKASVIAAAGQLTGYETDWEDSYHTPKAFLLYHPVVPAGETSPLPPPQRLAYLQGENLQSLEMVKEGFRRAIQSAMGSNFLPTQAQRRNEKSGIALDKIDQVAAQGTYHFVYAYEGLIRQTAVIGEDLMDKIYDFRGDVGVMAADGKASQIRINDPDHKDAINTTGDFLVTVSTAPSSDSERDAVDKFMELFVGNLQMVEAVAGPKIAAAVLARAIRMRNLGPMGDAIADLIEPPEFKTKDGEPPNPEMLAAQAQIQHLTQQLQQAAHVIETKQVEQQGKLQIAQLQTQATSADKAADREVKLAVAELSAKLERIALFIEESKLVGARADAARDRGHAVIEAVRDRTHERLMADAAHEHALEQGDQAAAHASDAAVQQAALTPPEQGAQA